MKTILVVDDERMILRLAKEAILAHSEEGIQVATALNGRQAVEVLNSTHVDLVITDLKMPEMDGYELLSHMMKHFKEIPVIVMTAYGSQEIAKRLRQKGVASYIEKPFDLAMLTRTVSEALFNRSKGYIHGFTLANFLQAIEAEQKTNTLKIVAKGREGFLHIEKGVLIDAEMGEVKGEAAAVRILCWDDPEIEIQPIQKSARTITASLMHILLESSKIKDETSEETPAEDDPLDKAIRLAEAHHMKEAQAVLAGILKQNPRNARAWLWFSRVILSAKSIKTALKNAARLAPQDSAVIQEIVKFNHAARSVKSSKIRHCPFCWAVAPVNAGCCSYCQAYMHISETFFSARRQSNKDLLRKAVERYTRVIGREKNIKAHYYLSIALLNLEQWEQALNLFHKTVKLAPGNLLLSDQLRILLNHLASVTEKTLDREESETPETPEARAAPGAQNAKKRILVVEDSSTTRKVISITLGQKGYEIIEARDGLEALSRLNEEKPDLILLDIILPKMDGYKILSVIKNNEGFRKIPVIMLTSRDSFMSKVKGKLAGSAAYLTKPFAPEKLVETIEKYI